jgi:hypothetical protein
MSNPYGRQTQWGYSIETDKGVLIARRLAYIAKHGCRFLFENKPPPAPGYPRAKHWRLLLPKDGPA